MSQCFLESYECSRENVKVELDLSYHATKLIWKEQKGIDISTLTPETDLACLETKVEQLDVGKL